MLSRSLWARSWVLSSATSPSLLFSGCKEGDGPLLSDGGRGSHSLRRDHRSAQVLERHRFLVRRACGGERPFPTADTGGRGWSNSPSSPLSLALEADLGSSFHHQHHQHSLLPPAETREVATNIRFGTKPPTFT
ncbi:hypothetical protein KIL84_010120, partial [Mauremys mutica]